MDVRNRNGINPSSPILDVRYRSYKSYSPSLMLIVIDGRPCSLSLKQKCVQPRNAIKINRT